eukprot:ANDGO_06434.mRNA.1 hypothetical protein PPTG_09636
MNADVLRQGAFRDPNDKEIEAVIRRTELAKHGGDDSDDFNPAFSDDDDGDDGDGHLEEVQTFYNSDQRQRRELDASQSDYDNDDNTKNVGSNKINNNGNSNNNSHGNNYSGSSSSSSNNNNNNNHAKSSMHGGGRKPSGIPLLDLSQNVASSPRRSVLLSSARSAPETERLLFDVRDKIFTMFSSYLPTNLMAAEPPSAQKPVLPMSARTPQSLTEKQKLDKELSQALHSFLENVFSAIGLDDVSVSPRKQSIVSANVAPSNLHSSNGNPKDASNNNNSSHNGNGGNEDSGGMNASLGPSPNVKGSANAAMGGGVSAEGRQKIQEVVSIYKQRTQEVVDRLKRNDMQLDYLRGQLARRDSQFKKMRQAYLRELTVLREQLIQACKLGDKFRPEWMMFYDWTGNEEEAQSTGEKSAEQQLNSMREKFEKEMNALKFKMKQEMDELRAALEEAQQRLAEGEERNRREMQAMKASYETKIVEMQRDFDQQMRDVKGEYEEQMETMKAEHEDEIRSLRDRYEDELAHLRGELEELTDRLRLKEEEIAHAAQQHEEEMANLNQAHKAQMEQMELEYKQKITELEYALKEAQSSASNAQSMLERAQMSREDALSRLGSNARELTKLRGEVARGRASLDEEKRKYETRIKDLEDEIRRLKESNANAISQSLVKEIDQGMKRDDELVAEIASTNWGIIKAQTRLKIVEETKEDPLAHLDVFTRLAERYNLMLERQRQLKEALMKERQRNMERVLSSCRLLVNPQQKQRAWRVPSLHLYGNPHAYVTPTSTRQHGIPFVDTTNSPSPKSVKKPRISATNRTKSPQQSNAPYYGHRNFSAMKRDKEKSAERVAVSPTPNEGPPSESKPSMQEREVVRLTSSGVSSSVSNVSGMSPRPPSASGIKRISVSEMSKQHSAPRRGVQEFDSSEDEGLAGSYASMPQSARPRSSGGASLRKNLYDTGGRQMVSSFDDDQGGFLASVLPPSFRPPSAPYSMQSRGPSALSLGGSPASQSPNRSLSRSSNMTPDRRQAVLDLLYRGRLSLGRPGSAGPTASGAHTAR